MDPLLKRLLVVLFMILTSRILSTEGSLTTSCSAMPPLDVWCTSNGVTGYAVIQCFRSNNIASITCSIDGGEEENNCTLPLILTAEEVGMGEHIVGIVFTDVCGHTAVALLYILWEGPLPPAGCSSPPPLDVQCSAQGVPGVIAFQCYATNNLESVTCSVDGVEVQSCSFPLYLTADEYGGGRHTLFARWTDVCGQTAERFESFPLSYPQNIHIGFEQAEYTTTEAAGIVELCVVVMDPPEGANREFPLFILLTQGSTSVSDFAMECNNSLLFHEGDTHKCHNITIHNDNVCEWNNEANEYFTAHLVDTSYSNIGIYPFQVRTLIDDSNEPECSIHVGYNRSIYTVSEDEGHIELCVQVTHSQRGAARPFSLSVFTSNGTAVSDTNYVAVDGEELLFPTGVEGETLCHNISIIKSDECSAADSGLNLTSNLISSSFNIILDPSYAVIVISDHKETECGPILVGYDRTFVIINETTGVVQLCAVILSGEHLRPFHLSVSTINSTADSNDYEMVSGEVLVFNTTDTELCHYINITDDRECEYDGCDSEFFMSQLSTDDYNVQLVNSTAQIIIEDRTEDECKNVHRREDCDLISTPPSLSGYSSSSNISDGMTAVIVFLIIIPFLIVVIVILPCIYHWRTKKLQKYNTTGAAEISSAPFENLPIQSSAIQELLQQLPKRMVFSKDQLRLSNTVGQGEFGLVYKAYLSASGGNEIVAVKTGKALFSTTDVKKLIKEVMTMLSFDHPNVMSLIGVCLNREMPLLIMPFMANGSVLEYVKHHKEELLLTSEARQAQVMTSRKLLLGMCHQIAKGMEYLAQHKFVHRDLAARNCMIDMQGVIKVADFGLTEDMYGTNYYRRQKSEEADEERVPIRWMAPESIENGIYNEKTDVWAFGVTCWEVLTCGRVPYHGISALGLLAALKNGERLEKPNNIACSDEIYATIMDCWHTDQKDRPKFANLAHQLSNLLEQEAGYLDLGPSLSWRKHAQPHKAHSVTVHTMQNTVEEEVKDEEH